MSQRKKRRARKHVGLGFELLENRTLLAASPISGGMSGQESGHTAHRTADHAMRPAELQTEAARNQSRRDDHASSGNGARNGEPPQRGSRSKVPGEVARPPLFHGTAPPPPQDNVPLTVPNAPLPVVVAGGFVAPSLSAEPPIPALSVGLDSSLTIQPADLSDRVSQSDLLAEGEFPAVTEALRNPADANAIVLSSTATGVPSGEPRPGFDTNIRHVFAALEDSDLREDKLTYLDEILEARLAASNPKRDSDAATDAAFASSSPHDRLHTDSGEARKVRPFRNGFVDIEESLGATFGWRLPKSQTEAGDSDESQDDSPPDFIADEVARDRIRSGAIWRLFEAMRLVTPTARDTESVAQEHSDLPLVRDGMVELVHSSGNSLAEGFAERLGEAETPVKCEPSFLKMNAAVVRYQAFEIAPLRPAEDSEPLYSADSESSAEGDTSEQPSAENVSTAARDRSAHPVARASAAGASAAGASVVPAILTFLSRRRLRRRGTSTD